MNKEKSNTSATQGTSPMLVDGQYELCQLISETTLAQFFHAHDLLEPDTEENHLIIAAVSPLLAACDGFEQAWQRVMAEFSRPDSPINVMDTCQSAGSYWIIFNQPRGEMLSEYLKKMPAAGLSPSIAQAQLLQLLRASKHIMPNGGFGFLEPGAIWRSNNHCQLLNAPLVIILRLLLKLSVDRREPLALQSAYISPEVANGMPPTTHDDTFSIACIAHHLLQGSAPFTPNSSLTAFKLNQQPPALAFLKTETRASLRRALSWQRHIRQTSPYELVHAFTEVPMETENTRTLPSHFLRKAAPLAMTLSGLISLAVYYSPPQAPTTAQVTQVVQTTQTAPLATPIIPVTPKTMPIAKPTSTLSIVEKTHTHQITTTEEKIISKVSVIKDNKQNKLSINKIATPPEKKKAVEIKLAKAPLIKEQAPLLAQRPEPEIIATVATLPTLAPDIPPASKPATPIKHVIKVVQTGTNTFVPVLEATTPSNPPPVKVVQTGKNTFVVATE